MRPYANAFSTDLGPAIVTGAFTLVATLTAAFGTMRIRQRGDERLRRLDNEHDHRERLQDRRLAAYEVFDIAFAHRRRAYDRWFRAMENYWRLNDRVDSLVTRGSEYSDAAKAREESRVALDAEVDAAIPADDALEDALDGVATTVYDTITRSRYTATGTPLCGPLRR